MAQEVIMPKLGLTMTVGILTRWLKKIGDPVRKGEAIAEIETDKISSTIESTADGYLLKIYAEQGEEKAIAAPICLIGEAAEIVSADPETITNRVREEAQRIFITPIAKKIA